MTDIMTTHISNFIIWSSSPRNLPIRWFYGKAGERVTDKSENYVKLIEKAKTGCANCFGGALLYILFREAYGTPEKSAVGGSVLGFRKDLNSATLAQDLMTAKRVGITAYHIGIFTGTD